MGGSETHGNIDATQAAISMGGSVSSAAPATPDLQIGETHIRFYSGNLSVSEFMAYWGTGGAGQYSGATKEQNALLKRCSVTSMCDYLAWCLAEKEQGVWDFSFYSANERILDDDGIGYNIFAWLHFPPKWFEDDPRSVRYQSLATGETIPQLSLWAPFTLKLYDEFYRRLAAEMGERIDFVRLAMPSEYGEIGYCAGMTNWLRTQPNAKPAYWCGDPHALQSFREFAIRRYRDLDAVNKAWGTAYGDTKDIRPPDVTAGPSLTDSSGRLHWLDFADWYNDSWDVFMRAAVGIVRKHFPGNEIIISLGYGSEQLCYGNDEGRYIASMARLGVSAQTPGDIGYFATRRVSSACRAYGVPYYTEPPGDVPPDRQVSRIWMDASNGTQTWFDYPANLDRARDLFVRYKQHLAGKPPRCGLGIWMPTAHHWLHPDQGWPDRTLRLADSLRPNADYEVLDDRMVRDGALQKLGIRMLVIAEADVMDAASMAACLKWVAAGGVLVCLATIGPGVRGDLPAGWGSISEEPSKLAELPDTPDAEFGRELWRSCARTVGKGRVFAIDSGDAGSPALGVLVASLDRAMGKTEGFRPGSYVMAPGAPGAVLSTFFDDGVLMMNTGTAAVKGPLAVYDGRDFRAGAPWQPAYQGDVELEGREIRAIPLQRDTH